ncbi:MAG: metallophosphoesterase family protein [Saprospiraceae bacterium]|nr:metallophosphoesterase family protein [Saprospiraceae bacterium]
MALIGLLSDTHSVLDARIFTHFADCDEVWHAGDFGSLQVVRQIQAFKPLRGVYGNIDGPEIRALFSEDLRFEIQDVPVFMTHIGGYPGKYAPRVRKLLAADPPRGGLFICGHSHILKVMYDHNGGFLHLNPGACGNEGWHKVKTLLRFQVTGGRVHGLELIEMGGRTSTR